MLKNTQINTAAVKKIAIALQEMNDKAVFVGGAVVSLYIDDPAADDVRPTKDVDITLEIVSLGQLEKIRNKLIQKGFIQSSEDNVICRFRYEDIKVDVMATKPIGWAPANPWFKKGFKHIQIINLDGINIKILPLNYFLASKFTAFNDRGTKDPRTSKDFEDIVYLLNYTSNIKELIISAQPDVKSFLIESFREVLDNPEMQEAMMGNLFYENKLARMKKINDNLRNITSGM